MQEWITPLNLAVIGGIVGGLRAAAKSTDTVFLRLTDVLIGAMVAASASYYVPSNAPLGALALGVVVGRVAGHAVDVVYNLVPQLLPLLIKVLTAIQTKGKDT